MDLIEGQPYQIVAVPVRAPALIGWVGMAFRLDTRLLLDMQQLSGLEVAVVHRMGSKNAQVSMSTLPAGLWPNLLPKDGMSRLSEPPADHKGPNVVDLETSQGTYAALGAPDFDGMLRIAHDMEALDLGTFSALPSSTSANTLGLATRSTNWSSEASSCIWLCKKSTPSSGAFRHSKAWPPGASKSGRRRIRRA